MKQRFGILKLAMVAAGFAVASCASASAGDAALQNACFSPQALAGVAGEDVAHKGIHIYDAPAKIEGFSPATPVANNLRGAIRRVDLPAGEKVIALTFDLCEQRGEIAGYDGRVIDYLRQQGVKATFFAGGKWMASHQERTEQLMLDPLFEIGNHTETHRNLRLATPKSRARKFLRRRKSMKIRAPISR